MTRVYRDEESPNGVRHQFTLHRINCDLCDEFVQRKYFPQRTHHSRTDVGYVIPEGLYFAGTATDTEPFALKGWATFSVITGRSQYGDRREIEGYGPETLEETLDICPRHVADVMGMINRTKPSR